MPTLAKFLFSTADGSHILSVDVGLVSFTAFLSLVIKLDNQQIEKKQANSLIGTNQLNGKYLVNLKTCIGELEISGFQNAKQGMFKTPATYLAESTSAVKLIFVINGQNIPIGQHIKLVDQMTTASVPSGVNAAAQPQVVVNVQPQSNSAVAPSLPPHCSQCGASLHMNSVKWTGPLSAACPTCGSAIQVVWNKIG